MKRWILFALALFFMIPVRVYAAGFVSGEYDFELGIIPNIGVTETGSWSTATTPNTWRSFRATTSTTATSQITLDATADQLVITGFCTATLGCDIALWDGTGAVLHYSMTGTSSGGLGLYFDYIIDDIRDPAWDLVGDVTVTFTMMSAGTMGLDSFRVWQTDAPGAVTVYPTSTPPNTPVDTPTAINIDATLNAILTALCCGGSTPLPTWTAAPSVTPAPTTTPQPTATPPGFVWVIDPAQRFVDIDGQPAALNFSVNAGDGVLFSLLVAIFVLLLVNAGIQLWKQ